MPLSAIAAKFPVRKKHCGPLQLLYFKNLMLI